MPGSDAVYPFADLDLARRLERTEGRASASFVDARARLSPESGAARLEVAGAIALFDGPASPITQTFGLGMFARATESDLDALETFFRERGAPVYHEVSPLADADLPALLGGRGYHPFEFTSLMFRPLRPGPRPAAPGGKVHARRIAEEEAGLWAATAAEGWSESAGLVDAIRELSWVTARKEDSYCFLAEGDGQAMATGALCIHDGVALLAGASTIPRHRKQGAQQTLLDARLRFAVDQGCDLAMMGATPGSASQRNAERHGFRIAYTRIKWRLPADPGGAAAAKS